MRKLCTHSEIKFQFIQLAQGIFRDKTINLCTTPINVNKIKCPSLTNDIINYYSWKKLDTVWDYFIKIQWVSANE